MAYRLSSLAEQDLDEIRLYVAEDASADTADRVIDDLINRFSLLAERPGWAVFVRNSATGFGLSLLRTTSTTTGPSTRS